MMRTLITETLAGLGFLAFAASLAFVWIITP
jgi:hypothetical protein